VKLTPDRISLAHWRQQARVSLKEARLQQGFSLASEVELAALNGLEEFVRSEPDLALVPGRMTTESKSPIAKGYVQALTRDAMALTGASASHVLSPALQSMLQNVNWQALEEAGLGFEMMGRVDDVSVANKAVGPTQSMDWGVEITGHWSPEQLQNVQSAVTELSRKTGTKAMNLLREVHLRTHLGTLDDGAEVLGVTRTVGPIALQRNLTEHSGSTRWVLFHEVGHQLDRFLSGSSRRFRSHDADVPFGKSTDMTDYVDPHQVSNPHEDFADCHARLIFDWDQIQVNPDLYLHGRGQVGEKMAWILHHAYKETVPEPGESYGSARHKVESGLSPFPDLARFHGAVNIYLDTPDRLPRAEREWLEQFSKGMLGHVLSSPRDRHQMTLRETSQTGL
jgi:hypothetical protein